MEKIPKVPKNITKIKVKISHYPLKSIDFSSKMRYLSSNIYLKK